MARTALSVQTISVAGQTPSFTAGDQPNGHEFQNDGHMFLEVKNTGAGTCTVTIQTPGKVGGVEIADPTVIVPITSGDKMIGPFEPTIFNQAGGTGNSRNLPP